MYTSNSKYKSHPYEDVLVSLNELKKTVNSLVSSIKKEDHINKYYTRKEVSILTKSSIQTIDNYIDKGWIKVELFGPKKKLIHHYQIFNEDQTLKNFKYKRKA
ncbi:hypothetical protein [Tenacibaculum mesophilum]|uniref:hypothetical protein n=1 Tax=Tenacibaculum mesophilum TaxID=104268 RepID=UPI00064A1C7F|nr:hypothetical protein [Tenacibaculum mesophilum]